MSGRDPEVVNILRAIEQESGKKDYAGRQSVSSTFGDRHTSVRRNQIALNFEYGVSDRDVSEDNVGDGDVIHEASQVSVQSGTDTPSRGRFDSINETRYIASLELYSYFAVRFDEPTEGNIQRFGLYDDQSGFHIGFNEDGLFGISDRANGSDVFIERDDFSDDSLDGEGTSVVDIDLTQFNLYRIVSGSLGVSPIFFEVYTGFELGWVTFHIRELTDIQRSVTVPNLPVRVESINKPDADISSSTNIEMVFASAGLAGQVQASPTDRSFSNSRSFTLSTTGSLRNVFTLKSKDEFQGKVNRIQALVGFATMSADGNKPVSFSLIENATLSSSNFQDVDSDNSVMEVSETNAGVSGGRIVFPIQIQKADAQFVSLPSHNESGTVEILPGNSITLAAQSSNTSDLVGSLRWSELF